MDQARIESGPQSGLLEIVRAAATAVSGPKHDPVGRLEITRIAEAASRESLHIEASASAHGAGWTVEQLDVRAHWDTHTPLTGATLRGLLDQFGSRDFVSFTVLDGSRELMDLTLSFSSRLQFLATNQLILGDGLSPSVVSLCAHMMQKLGMRAYENQGALRVRTQQFRFRPEISAVVEAFQLATAAGLNVALYASTLPALRSVRVAQGPGDARSTPVDICISLGFGGGQARSERAKEVELFFQRAFALGFGGQSWQVSNAHGRAEAFRAQAVLAPRPRGSWSLNWGQRKSG
jgi:hypothetical protein